MKNDTENSLATEWNLDDEAECTAFIERFGTAKGRRLANALGIKGKGAARIASDLSGYAWNKSTAIECRKAGNIQSALVYEGICQRIYADLPEDFRW